jgi:hypothetical protein
MPDSRRAGSPRHCRQEMSRPVFSRLAAQTTPLDNALTPLEIAELLRDPTHQHLPFAIAPLLRESPPTCYVREELNQDVRLYSANRGACTLIVAFGGASHRLMKPISHFLQMMSDDIYDVLVITDAKRRHHDAGIRGYSNSLLETLVRIKALSDTRSYRRLVTYGTSMGGFPALRAGLWLGADRAVSVGGAFCSHPPRLLQGSNEVGAFDLLCHCRPRGHVPVVTAFSTGHSLDVERHAALRAVLPDCVELKINSDRHNVIHHLDRRGQLPAFYATIFGESDVSPSASWRPAKSKASDSHRHPTGVWQRLFRRCRALFRR